MEDKVQQSLFESGELLSREEEEWQDMPEFVQEEQQSYAKIIIRFVKIKLIIKKISF